MRSVSAGRCRGRGGACCGALHVHAGLTDETQRLAHAGDRVDARRRSDRRQLGRLRRGAEGLRAPARHARTLSAFSARVRDVHEFVAEHLDRLQPTRRLPPVIVQDPCHLRHVQRTPSGRAHGAGQRCATWSSSTTTGCAAVPVARTRRSSPSSPARSASASSASIQRATAASGAVVVASANPGARCTCRHVASTSSTRSNWSPRRCRESATTATWPTDSIRSWPTSTSAASTCCAKPSAAEARATGRGSAPGSGAARGREGRAHPARRYRRPTTARGYEPASSVSRGSGWGRRRRSRPAW